MSAGLGLAASSSFELINGWSLIGNLLADGQTNRLPIFHKYDYHTWAVTMTPNNILPQDAINNAAEREILKVHRCVDYLVG